jgi:hypothetical protein
MFWSPATEKMHINHYFADTRDVRTVRRVLVLPLRVGDGIQVDEQMVRAALNRELNLIQRFQIEALPSGEDEAIAINAAFSHGNVSIPALVNLAKRYRLDGVLVARLTSYRPYQPQHIGLEARLFSLHTGSWIWIADATFDAKSAVCIADLNHYAKSVLRDSDVTGDSARLLHLSPQKFASYACNRLVGTWRAD